MKKTVPFYLFLVISMGMLLLGLDQLVGIPLKKSFFNIINPFWVMDIFEYVIVLFIFTLSIIIPIYKRILASRSN